MVSTPGRDLARGGHAGADRSLSIDLLKAGAAQFIALHHFVLYGPMAAAAERALPQTVAWLQVYGRLAVQVFLVVGGFLLARALAGQANERLGLATAARLIARRYLRLVWPFGVAVAVAVAVAAAARHWTQDEIIPAPASWQSVLAHWLLVHDILGFDALSTGVWYVAIDFQLYALVTLVAFIAARIGRPGMVATAIVALGLTSLFWVRGRPGWDVWAPWFIYAYGLGALAGYGAAAGLALLASGCALFIAFVGLDWQVLAAAAAAFALLVGTRLPPRQGRRSALAVRAVRTVRYLADASFALFLLHFPVSMAVNAAQDRFGWHAPMHGLFAMSIAWAFSMLVAHAFVRYVEPVGERILARLDPKEHADRGSMR